MKNKKRGFISLQVKSFLLVLMACGAAWLAYVGSQHLGYHLVNTYYLSESAANTRMQHYRISLQSFAYEKNAASTDFTVLQEWNDQNDVYLMVYSAKQELLFESDYWMEDQLVSGAGELAEGDGHPIEQEEVVSSNEGTAAVVQPLSAMENLHAVRFSDGDAWVSLIDYSDLMMLSLTDTIAIIMAGLTFSIAVIWFNHTTTKKILRLAHEVREIENGNLEKQITVQGHDELGNLSSDVDNMRQSVVQRLQKEEEARQANVELITAMSHDIRTPLTALIGYLDIVGGKKYRSQEQFDRYIRNSQEKALQLKELSDKLFQYFVVFGSAGREVKCSIVDAAQLISQVLGEQVLYLQTSGFEVQLQALQSTCGVAVEMGQVRRVFDNCLSNICKYADAAKPIRITAQYLDHCVEITFENAVKQGSDEVESTKIGLKSCQKMMEQMGGTFETKLQEDYFVARLFLPEVAGEEDIDAGK